MAVYRYKALDQQGQEIEGRIEATSPRDANNQLRAESIYVINMEVEHASLFSFAALKSGIKALNPKRYTSPGSLDKVLTFRQLALMLRSGNTLTQGLEVCSEMTEKRALQRALTDTMVRIQGGSSFASAIAAQGRMFPPVVSKLIASGESSGELQPTLERLAANLEQDATVRRQFISSMMYPSLLVLVAVAVFLGLALSIIPKFARMLEGRSQELPAMTQAMMDISAWLIDYGVYLGASIGGLVLSILIAYTTTRGKRFIDGILLNIPVLGTNIRTTAMAQMGWTMSMLLASGLTVLEALRVISSITSNLRLSRCFEEASNHILAGHSLAYGLQQPHIPVMVQHMTGIGERSGELEHVMRELGIFYQQQSERRIKAMLAMIEPAMTLIVGGMVAFVYIGFFKAMLQVSAG